MLHHRMSGELRVVGDDDVVRELAVMAKMCIRHDEVAISDPRGAAALLGSQTNRYVLADTVMVADHELSVGVVVAAVLRWAAEHRAALNVVSLADGHPAEPAADTRVRLDNRVGTNLDCALNHAIRADLGQGRDRRLLGNQDSGMNAQGFCRL